MKNPSAPSTASAAPAAGVPARRDGTRRDHLGVFLLVIVLCLGVAAYVLVYEGGLARGFVEREDQARDVLELVRSAEVAFHEREGRYGWIGELAEAGLLKGHEFGRDEDGEQPQQWVRTQGYRVDALLPHARLSADTVAIVTRGSGKGVDSELARAHFSLVARPLEPRRSGYRILYVDELGELYLNEGVIDDEGARRNLLPEIQVRRSATLNTSDYLLWQKAADISPKGD